MDVTDEARKLIRTAINTYENVQNVQSLAQTYLMKGNSLYEQVKIKTSEEADRLFAQAKELLLKAESILPGSAAYNIACWNAIRGQEDECRKWLEKCLNLKVMPLRQHLEKDQDLEKVREKPWFKTILARL